MRDEATQRRRYLARSLLTAALIVALVLPLSGAQQTQAQAFNPGSNGSDGALNLATPGEILFDPRDAATFGRQLDADGDNIYHFTSITIAAGVTVKLSGAKLNGPIYWLATGPVEIAGAIDLNGENGQNREAVLATGSRYPAVPGAGGFGGGVGYGFTSQSPPQSGLGPGGGPVAPGRWPSGAGHATQGFFGCGNPVTGQAYGNDFLVPLIGGSGGGGSIETPPFAATGGAGGGAILIASSGTITITGSITANGGQGGVNAGSGSGGAIRLVAPTISGAGSLSAVGKGSNNCGAGSSNGRIRLEAFQHSLTGTINPVPRRGVPSSIFLPEIPLSLRVASIASAPAPATPGGAFTSPDVTINSASAVDVTIEAKGIPPGTVVTLVVLPETGIDVVTDSPPLTGTLQQSSTTVSVTVPPGYSRMYVRAKWTP
jgi:hypothetical protein